MPKYQSKPKIFEVVQVSWKNWEALSKLLSDTISRENPVTVGEDFSDSCGEDPPYMQFRLGETLVKHGDYILKDEEGFLYCEKPWVFIKNYEEIPEGDDQP